MKFAHMSDIHLGFQTDATLQKVEQDVFEKALDECIRLDVDFVLIPGDMFHVNIPDMRVQKYAFAKFRQVHEAGIPVYVVYGSHDFSPVSKSVIDLLAETGYVTKVTRSLGGDRVTLGFVTDEKTGVKLAGLHGLKVGGDRIWYENLNREALEAEPGFKIFLFHGGISDMKADTLAEGDLMPLSLLPKGFSYYAGGHMHRFNHREFQDYPHVVYPGTPFAGYHSDLEMNAKGEERGFVLVEFEDTVKSIKLIPIKNTSYEFIKIDARNKTADSVNAELRSKIDKIDSKEKVVILKISGEMTSGKTADVDLTPIRESLKEAGSLTVKISKSGLTSKEYSITSAKGENRDEIEGNVFAENIGQLRFEHKDLLGEEGLRLARSLLMELGQGQLTNEKKADYSRRITDNAMGVLGLDKD